MISQDCHHCRLSQLFEISQQLEALADSIPANSPLPQVFVMMKMMILGSHFSEIFVQLKMPMMVIRVSYSGIGFHTVFSEIFFQTQNTEKVEYR